MSSSTELKVYFVENTETGRIKVGFTTGSVTNRLRALQTGSDCALRLLGVIAALQENGTTERQLHLSFSKHRHRGEWFTSEIFPEVIRLLREEDRRLGLA